MPQIGTGIGNNIEGDYLINWAAYWAGQEFQDGETFDNGKLVLQFDDGVISVYTTAFPLFVANGIKFTSFSYGQVLVDVPAPAFFNNAQALEMHQAGMDMQCHGTGPLMETLTDQEIIDDYVNNNINFLNAGIPAPKHTAYSVNSYNDHILTIVDDYRKTGRTTLPGFVNRMSSKYEMRAVAITGTAYEIENAIRAAAVTKQAVIFFGHNGGDVTQGIIDLALAYGLDIISTSALYDLMYYLDIRLSREDCAADEIKVVCIADVIGGVSISIERADDGGNTYSEVHVLDTGETDYLDSGLDTGINYYYRARGFRGLTYLNYSRVETISTTVNMVLTSTGSGAGVVTFEITPLKNMTITLDGNAHFYSDVDGTLNESATANLVRDIKSTLYIKCTAGDSNLSFPSNLINKINGWNAGANAPSLAFDIGVFTHLEYIYVTGLNTIYGSISNLVGLNFLRILGVNVVSGDIGNCPLLTYVDVQGVNTLHGSISALVLLRRLYVTGSNTIGGDISNLILLDYIQVTGTNTISGSLTNLVLLTTVRVLGNNKIGGILTSGVVDNLTFLYLVPCGMSEYTAGVATWEDISITINPSVGYGYGQTELTDMIIDINGSTPGPTGKIITLKGNSALMADTNQGGIWGDFSGAPTPTALATTYKNLHIIRTCTVPLNGIVVPGGTGDGTGFPAGFGDWYRS